MERFARAGLAVLFVTCLTGCVSMQAVSDQQSVLIRSGSRALHDALPSIHETIKASDHTGALVIWEADGTFSQPYLGDTPYIAVRETTDIPQQSGEFRLAAFVYRSEIPRYPEWFVLSTLQAESRRQQSLDEAIQSLRTDAERLTVESEGLRKSLAAVSDQIAKLEAFGVDMTRLGLLHKALIDGHEAQLTPLRKSVESLRLASAANASTLTATQKLVSDSLTDISKRLASIEAQVRK